MYMYKYTLDIPPISQDTFVRNRFAKSQHKPLFVTIPVKGGTSKIYPMFGGKEFVGNFPGMTWGPHQDFLRWEGTSPMSPQCNHPQEALLRDNGG